MIEDQWQSAAGHRYPVIGSETKEVMYVVDKYCCYLIRVVREIYRWKIPNFLQYQPFFLLRINAFCVLIISVIFFLGGGPTAICYKTNRVIVTGKKCIYPRKQKYNNKTYSSDSSSTVEVKCSSADKFYNQFYPEKFL